MDLSNNLIGFVAFLLLIVIGMVVIGLTTHNKETLRFQRKLFVTSFAIRFLMSILLYSVGLYGAVVGGGDDGGWIFGLAFMDTLDGPEGGIASIPSLIASTVNGINKGYPIYLGLFFYLTRLASQLSAAALSGFSGAMTCVVSYRIARLLFNEVSARRGAWWVCFFPNMIIWSSLTLKEPIVILLEACALYACLRLRLDKFTPRHALLCLACFLVLLSLRFYAAYIVAITVLASLALPHLGRGRFPIGSAIAIAGAFGYLIYSLSGSLGAHQEAMGDISVQKAVAFRSAVSTGGEGTNSGVATTRDMETAHGLGLETLIGAAHLLLAPFPWQMGGSLRLLLTAPEMAVWYVIFSLGVIRGVISLVRSRPGDALPFLIFLGSLGLIYSVMFGNVGIIYRQRAQLLPYLLPIGAWGLELRAGRAKA